MYAKSDLRRMLQNREKRRLPSAGLTPAAVLIPLYEQSGEHHVVFTKRILPAILKPKTVWKT